MPYVAIVGSRRYPTLYDIIEFVKRLPGDAIVVSGGAKGVDTIAVETALMCGLGTIVFPAEWDKHGRSAGYIRNKDIVSRADVVVAFWDGVSRGTAHSMDLALSMGKPLYCKMFWSIHIQEVVV
jgi:hypothetical protein